MIKKITSWMGAYSRESDVVVLNDINLIQKHLDDGYRIIGSTHSYNRIALHEKCIKLGEEFNYIYKKDEGVYAVGGACTVLDVMKFILKDEQRLINYGNNFTQNFCGAALGGTHGFGENALVADCILNIKTADGNVHTDLSKVNFDAVEVIIKTLPITQYEVLNCVCKLSELMKDKND